MVAFKEKRERSVQVCHAHAGLENDFGRMDQVKYPEIECDEYDATIRMSQVTVNQWGTSKIDKEMLHYVLD